MDAELNPYVDNGNRISTKYLSDGASMPLTDTCDIDDGSWSTNQVDGK